MPQIAGTYVTEWNDGTARRLADAVVVEAPLEVRVNGTPVVVTMRTPGHDEELAAGWLFTEGFIRDRRALAGIAAAPDAADDVVEVTLHESVAFDPETRVRRVIATSGCGLCGVVERGAVRVPGLTRVTSQLPLDPNVLCGLPAVLRHAQTVFARTGGLHAAALFQADGALLVIREDVGRHNAVDKAVGWALVEGRVPLATSVLLVSGRGGYEIIQKACAAGVPIIAAVSAPSSLAVALARELDVTLVGFLRDRRFLVYAGSQRLGLGTSGA
ncbi:MAG: formate dehydrogenase accessory sulfurtransferase FdhD [Luteitalea sp.]|nr:formate dehydrogenase accessory sulfurtransferase FdhD [Luteitalea sp.]